MPSASLSGSLPLSLLADPVSAATQVKDITVRLQTLDGLWETVGVDRMRGIVPEITEPLAADEWGPSTAGFALKRDPGVTWPDLGAWTPVEIDVAGRLVWDGRIKDTPTADGDNPVIHVQCEGWRAHLDDDVYDRKLVHTKLADYKDIRSFPGAALTQFVAGGVVNADRGTIQLAFPNGTALAGTDNRVGVMLDLGPGNTAKRIVLDWTSSNNDADFAFYARTSDVVDPGSAFSDAFTFSLASGAAGVTPGTFATARRYVALFIYYGFPAWTTTQDTWIRINSVKVFADTAYESGNASILTAPTIVRDALDRGTILLSPDRSGIDPGGVATFAYPEFAPEGQRSPREMIDAANAAMGWRTKIAVGRRPIYEPKPDAPAIEVGAWPGTEFTDASANSGADIYNRAIVEGTGADGQPVSVERSSSQLTGVTATPVTTPAADNPSFATNTTSWTASAGSSITRDTGVFDTSPASGRWDRGAGVALDPGAALTETFTGTFLAGVTYTLTVRLRPNVASYLFARFGNSISDARATPLVPAGVFTSITLSWTPTITATTGVALHMSTGSGWWYVDSLSLTAAQPTLVDRRGFRRTHVLPVKCSLSEPLGRQIGDTWLRAHRTTPLKGTVKVSGNGAVRHILTGRDIAPEELLLMTGELLRLSHRTDPDTGGQTRDGRIAHVKYDPRTDESTVALDSTRTDIEGLLERLAIVVGSS